MWSTTASILACSCGFTRGCSFSVIPLWWACGALSAISRAWPGGVCICVWICNRRYPRKDIWYYVGEKDFEGKRAKNRERFSSFLVDAKRYDDEDVLREELESLSKTLTYRIFELQRCSKCKKEFTEHPSLSREDNEKEICPECGVREAIETYQKATQKWGGLFFNGCCKTAQLIPLRSRYHLSYL